MEDQMTEERARDGSGETRRGLLWARLRLMIGLPLYAAIAAFSAMWVIVVLPIVFHENIEALMEPGSARQ